MLKAYVGVASKQGLSAFHPERDDTLSLVRRCLANWILGGHQRFGSSIDSCPLPQRAS